MTEDDIKNFFSMFDQIEKRGESIIAAMRNAEYEVEKATKNHVYPPLKFGINEFDITEDESGIRFSCTEYGQYGYVDGFSHTITMATLLDPYAETKIMDSISDSIAEIKHQETMRVASLATQREAEERATYEQLKEKYDA